MSQLAMVVALPLLAAFLLPLIGRLSRHAGHVLGLGILVIVELIVLAVWAAAEGAPISLAIGGFHPPLGISFYADDLAFMFAAAVPVMTLLLWPRDDQDEDLERRQVLTLVLAAACGGLALSGDLFNLYVFYELAAVASYGLVADRRSGAGMAAAFRYLTISALGSVLALVGIGLVYFQTGTLNLGQLAQLRGELAGPLGLSAFLCLLIGFGVKAELFPVNTWVPEAYAAASKRTAALLAGLVSKLAVLVVLRLLVLLFPYPETHAILLVLGLLGVISGELAAWRARDLTRMLAWSSIGQLGLVFVAFSISGEAGIVAGIAVALHHLIAKPALFLLAERWGGSLEQLAGVARRSPLAGVLFVLFALSLVGVPPFPGFWAKFLLLSGLAEVGGAAQFAAIALVLAATVLEANYLLRVVTRMYGPGDPYSGPKPHHGLDLSTATLFGLVLVGSVFALGPIWSELVIAAGSAGDVPLYIATTANSLGVTGP
jgi:formate hydrogenlyase subunit 3/multisubunit Na+/H+ antiporter MnhD subunit